VKFNKLVQTILNEYDEVLDHSGKGKMIWYVKCEPYTNENGRQFECKYQSRYDYEKPPSEEDGWFPARDKKKAEEFVLLKKKEKSSNSVVDCR